MTKKLELEEFIAFFKKERPRVSVNPGYGAIESLPKSLSVQLTFEENRQFLDLITHMRKHNPAYQCKDPDHAFDYNQLAAEVFMFGLIKALKYLEEIKNINNNEDEMRLKNE